MYFNEFVKLVKLLLRQEKDNLQKEIFLKNCMNLLAIKKT